jgi:hypothetical protein
MQIACRGIGGCAAGCYPGVLFAGSFTGEVEDFSANASDLPRMGEVDTVRVGDPRRPVIDPAMSTLLYHMIRSVAQKGKAFPEH